MFEQAIMNLVVNAYDAMPNGGKLIIKTKYIESLYDIKLLSNIIKHHSYAVISVIDNGCGIDSNDIDKLFEPFFTTKNIGKGSGLGLSQVYGTIKRFNGIIDVHSKLNSGASFIIYLPVV
jgi:two-component system cell cycle sensor histidine kinase/response regulator CckA